MNWGIIPDCMIVGGMKVIWNKDVPVIFLQILNTEKENCMSDKKERIKEFYKEKEVQQ